MVLGLMADIGYDEDEGDYPLNLVRQLLTEACTGAPVRELNPKDVLIDLFGGGDFDHEILDPERAAEIVIERLRDAGFEIVPARGAK